MLLKQQDCLRLLFVLLQFKDSYSASFPVYDFIGSGDVVFKTNDDIVLDSAVLAEDTVGNLPDAFTICSSIYLKYVLSRTYFIQTFKKDGTNWYNYYVQAHDFSGSHGKSGTYVGYIFFNGVYIGISGHISIRPHSWFHGCISLDVNSKKLSLVVNGELVYENELATQNMKQDKPDNIKGKIGLGVGGTSGNTLEQSRAIISNINVYGKALSVEEMEKITDGPPCSSEGDYLSWRDSKWALFGNVVETNIETNAICKRAEVFNYLFPDKFPTHKGCMEFCLNLKQSKAPRVEDEAQAAVIKEWYKGVIFDPKTNNVFPGILKNFWARYSEPEEEGTWVDFYTGKVIPLTIFGPGQPNGGRGANCGSSFYNWGCFMNDDPCVSETVQRHCVCQNTIQPMLKLRGLCPKSNMDKYYIPKNDETSGQMVYYGLQRTKMFYNEGGLQWNAEVLGKTEATVANNKASKLSFLLGAHDWTIDKDSKDCNRGEEYNKVLKLTGCEEDEFTCKDGQCVSMKLRCDQIINCRDKSDEEDCSMLVIENSYNKKVAPFSTVSETDLTIVAVPVNITMVLMNIIEIAEVQHIIELKFGIMLEWYENRALFYNLKDEITLNALTQYEINKLWTPYVIYQNTDKSEAVRLGGDVDTTITVTREGKFTRSDMTIADEIEIFRGSENKLTMNQTDSKRFHCTYQLQNYPFDTQICRVDMVVQKLDFRTVSLIPDTIVMESETVLTQYVIATWSLVYRNESDPQSGIKMEVVFKRRLTNEVLTTYLPSVLLILITYATTLFKPYFFEAALTVNLTTMLVMTTIFISVMEKLPSTAYVKMVDIWLIFGQLIPFIEVIILTIMESCRSGDGSGEEDQTLTINHHGHPREISLPKKSVSVISVEAFDVHDEKKPEYSGSKEHLVPVFEMIEEKVIPGIVLAFSAFYIIVGYLYYAEIM